MSIPTRRSSDQMTFNLIFCDGRRSFSSRRSLPTHCMRFLVCASCSGLSLPGQVILTEFDWISWISFLLQSSCLSQISSSWCLTLSLGRGRLLQGVLVPPHRVTCIGRRTSTSRGSCATNLTVIKACVLSKLARGMITLRPSLSVRHCCSLPCALCGSPVRIDFSDWNQNLSDKSRSSYVTSLPERSGIVDPTESGRSREYASDIDLTEWNSRFRLLFHTGDVWKAFFRFLYRWDENVSVPTRVDRCISNSSRYKIMHSIKK